MIVKKFYAASTRDALRQVRDALGAEALILSNRQVAGGGIEIMAVAEADVVAVADQPNERLPEVRVTTPSSQAVTGTMQVEAKEAPTFTPLTNPGTNTDKPVSASQNSNPVNEAVVHDIANEIRFLRSMLEGQLAGFAWNDMQRREPAKIEILKHMLGVGFSPMLCRELLDNLSSDHDHHRGVKSIKTELIQRLQAVQPSHDLIEQGGVYALVGPTGVGKTTTVAKLAARAVLKHGAAKIALLTTDSYRIGAHDQLRIYGKILNVPVYAVKDETDLQLTLADLQNRHLILIDTVGMSQRDRRLAEQVALLCGGGRQVKRLLLLSAISQATTLEDVVGSYDGAGMDGCVLTKVDEALNLSNVLDIIVRHKIPLHYVTNGQRVPEDLHSPNLLYLVDRAFRVSPDDDSPYEFQENEYPLLMVEAVVNRESANDPHVQGIKRG